jgi:hypothetical protein
MPYKVYKRLVEDFSPNEAIQYLRKLDKDLYSEISDKGIKGVRGKYSLKFHPDKGHNPEEMKLINQAFDVLERNSNSARSSDSYSNSYDNEPEEDLYPNDPKIKGVPIWAWAGYAGGSPPFVSNSSYDILKREAWVLAGEPTESKVEQYYYQLFDGNFPRSSITLLSNKASIKKTIPLFLQWCDSFKKVAVIVYHIPNNSYNKERPSFINALVFPLKNESEVLNPVTVEFDNDGFGNIFNDKNNVKLLKKSLGI